MLKPKKECVAPAAPLTHTHTTTHSHVVAEAGLMNKRCILKSSKSYTGAGGQSNESLFWSIQSSMRQGLMRGI